MGHTEHRIHSGEAEWMRPHRAQGDWSAPTAPAKRLLRPRLRVAAEGRARGGVRERSPDARRRRGAERRNAERTSPTPARTDPGHRELHAVASLTRWRLTASRNGRVRDRVKGCAACRAARVRCSRHGLLRPHDGAHHSQTARSQLRVCPRRRAGGADPAQRMEQPRDVRRERLRRSSDLPLREQPLHRERDAHGRRLGTASCGGGFGNLRSALFPRLRLSGRRVPGVVQPELRARLLLRRRSPVPRPVRRARSSRLRTRSRARPRRSRRSGRPRRGARRSSRAPGRPAAP